MKFYLKTKLIIIFSTIIVMTGLITAFVGILLITRGVMNQVQGKVRSDLNSAREILNDRIQEIQSTIYLSSLRNCIKNGLIKEDMETRQSLGECLEHIKKVGNMEIAAITDRNGVVVLRAQNPACFGDDLSNDQIISKVLSTKQIVAGPIIISREELKKEGEEFAKRAHIRFIDTPKAKKKQEREETSGMMLMAAAPVWGNNGDFIGVLYGGTLINRNYHLVDKIKNTVYRGEIYKGMDMGTATIFQKDLRISTNVISNRGERAIGTRVSEEVYDRVVGEGRQWIGRAFVVNAWYVTAYEPLRGIDGQIIGMLYVGMLEQKFVDMRSRALLTFFAVTIIGMILVLIVSNFFANTITKPINYLVKASKIISGGEFFVRVMVKSRDELGELEKAFNAMASGLQERDEELKNQTQRQLMRSEKLAALGRMAAGIAHEINNPLTGVLMYGHMLQEKFSEGSQDRQDVETIVSETTRCREIIKNLLNFSRESVPHKEPADINEVINKSIAIIEKQVYFEKVEIIKEFSYSLPYINVDINQIEQVLINLALNAVEVMPDGGELILQTKFDGSNKNVIIKVTDTGCGIPEENMDKIFDPFFTTKETGKGTGLGLAVSYGIIKKHGGQIGVESAVDSGTTFTITLPVDTSNTVHEGGNI